MSVYVALLTASEATFDRDVAALPVGTPAILEDGTFQNVSQLLNSGAFVISIQSDLATSEIPEPASDFLLILV